jgi:hypothetical protein
MLSKRSIEMLLDLAENKLSDIVPVDRDDMREVKMLQAAVTELRSLRSGDARKTEVGSGMHHPVHATTQVAA